MSKRKRNYAHPREIDDFEGLRFKEEGNHKKAEGLGFNTIPPGKRTHFVVVAEGPWTEGEHFVGPCLRFTRDAEDWYLAWNASTETWGLCAERNWEHDPGWLNQDPRRWVPRKWWTWLDSQEVGAT